METPTTLADTLRERVIALESTLENASKASNAQVAVLENQVASLQQQLIDRLDSSRESIALALASAEKTTSIAQNTADKAMVKADAKADMAYLEAQIRSLKDAFMDQIAAQKEAITAALNASQSALKAALESSEKAITKAEEANEKRFAAVNEFRSTLSDQQKTFVVKDEVEFKFQAVEKKMDESLEWQRRTDLKFNDYLLSRSYEAFVSQSMDWRRQVDGALTANSSGVHASRTTVQSGRDNIAIVVSILAVIVAMAIAVMKFNNP